MLPLFQVIILHIGRDGGGSVWEPKLWVGGRAMPRPWLHSRAATFKMVMNGRQWNGLLCWYTQQACLSHGTVAGKERRPFVTLAHVLCRLFASSKIHLIVLNVNSVDLQTDSILRVCDFVDSHSAHPSFIRLTITPSMFSWLVLCPVECLLHFKQI